jgi:3-oxoadipate enol-lactonase
VEVWAERIQAVRDGGMPAIRERVVGRFLSEAFREHRPDVARRLGEMLVATPAAGYIAACQALQTADLGTVVGRIRAPTLVVVGALDEATPPAQAEALRAAIPRSELSILDHAAHLPNVERPDAFNAEVLTFLAR